MSRIGDFTNKRYIYKFYSKGYGSNRTKFMTAGQYIGITSNLKWDNQDSLVSYGYNVDTSTMSAFIMKGGSEPDTLTGYIETDTGVELEGISALFNHSYFDDSDFNLSGVTSYYIKFFDYTIEYVKSSNELSVYYGETLLDSVTMSSSYDWIRFRESEGTVYIDTSDDGLDWNNWVDNEVSINDITYSTLRLGVDAYSSASADASVALSSIDITPRTLLAVEIDTLGETGFGFTEQINTPAATAAITLNIDPLEGLPDYIKHGNYVEVHVSLEDLGNTIYEPILDENSDPIEDENGHPIYGGLSEGVDPEEKDIHKFSGYIESIDSDYNNSKVTLNLVSHGEALANILMTSGEKVENNVIEQKLQNASESTTNRRQTFTPQRNLKLDGIRAYVSADIGGVGYIEIGQGNTVLATTIQHTWSGGAAAGIYDFKLSSPIYLETNQTYWFRVVGYTTWYYQNTDVYDGGSRQQFSGGSWSNVAGDAYFEMYSINEESTYDFSGTIEELVEEVFENVKKTYTPLHIESIDNPSYTVRTTAQVDTTKNMLDTALKMSPTGYWYSINHGTGAYKLKSFPSVTEHTFALGRDFTNFELNSSIAGIINDVLFIGADINENQAKLAIRTTDNDSIQRYKRGLLIESNGKVSRYDSAQLLSNYSIDNNNKPRITTSITIPASLYNIETIRIGDLVTIVNTNDLTLAQGLQIAQIDYNPDSVTISLDSAPTTINSNVDRIRRELENTTSSGVESVI